MFERVSIGQEPVKTFLKDCRWGRFILLRGDMISQYVDMYGEWSETEIDLFKQLLPTDGVCIEIGSNIGMHAVPLSMICGEGRVYCFEPQRPLFHILCGNIALNNRLNVVARNQAVGDKRECVDIETSDYDENWNYGSFSVTSGFSREGSFKGAVRKEPVDVISLDDDSTIGRLDRVHLIKIDVEGFEPKVLRGAKKLIARHKPDIFVEANEQSVVGEILNEMRAQGYVGYWFVAHRYREDNFNRSQFSVDAWDPNIIFRRPERGPLPDGLREVKDFDDLAKGVPILHRYGPGAQAAFDAAKALRTMRT
jgi:FkbM family methyltransferase